MESDVFFSRTLQAAARVPLCERGRSTRHDATQRRVCSEAHLDSNSSSRRGAVATGGWTASQIITFRKGTSSPSSLVGVCVAPPGLEDPMERTSRWCPFSGPDRSETLPSKAGTSRSPSRVVWDGGFPGGSVGNHPAPTRETRVSSPAREDPTRYRATRPIGLADGICALDPGHRER